MTVLTPMRWRRIARGRERLGFSYTKDFRREGASFALYVLVVQKA